MNIYRSSKDINFFQQDYSDEIVDELYTDPTEPIEDDNFLYDEEEDSDAEETYGDSFSIGSNQRPKLRYAPWYCCEYCAR